MRKPEYLSPSALDTYRKDKQEYFIKYLCDVRAPKIPQTPAMAVGSAFDACVKSHLFGKLCLSPTAEDLCKYDRQTLFDSQVESHNRQEVWEYGNHLFEMYKESGALSDLMIELSKAVDEPKFELELRGVIRAIDENVSRTVHGVTLLGKPDVRFINSFGHHVILDWKVNGFLSKSPVSPQPGYIMCREHAGSCWNRQGCHKDAFITEYQGMKINNRKLEDVNVTWASQLATYGWLMGSPVGEELIVAVDQFCGNKAKLRIASHRCVVGRQFQLNLLNEYLELWNIIYDPKGLYFFRDLSRDDSVLKQESLEKQVSLMGTTTDSVASAILSWSR